MQAIPSVDLPIPLGDFDITLAIDALFSTFNSAWYLGIALLLFLIVGFLRGKAKIGGVPVRIYKLSDWLDDKGSKAKFWLIIGFTGLGSAFAALINVETWAFMEIITEAFRGLLNGSLLALAAMGIKSGTKAHRTTEKPSNELLESDEEITKEESL